MGPLGVSCCRLWEPAGGADPSSQGAAPLRRPWPERLGAGEGLGNR